MITINIPSLRDPATLISLKRQLMHASVIVSAYEAGAEDARGNGRYASSLDSLMREVAAAAGVRLSDDDVLSVHEAYNLGWDTVRLNRGVQHG